LDRFTWAVVGGVVGLGVVAIVNAAVFRGGPPPDRSTPGGVASAYILAVQSKHTDEAWELLDSPRAVDVQPVRGGTPTKEDFQRQVNNSYSDPNKRIRLLKTDETGDTARVDLEITHVSQAPVLLGGGSSSRTVSMSLKRSGESWRITSAPPIYELG
jgi:hypothetical protein